MIVPARNAESPWVDGNVEAEPEQTGRGAAFAAADGGGGARLWRWNRQRLRPPEYAVRRQTPDSTSDCNSGAGLTV